MKKFYSWGIGPEPVIQYFPDLKTALQDEQQLLDNYKSNGWNIIEPFGTREVTEENPVYRIHLKVPITNKISMDESDYVKYMYLCDFSKSKYDYEIAANCVEYLQTVFNKKEHLEYFSMPLNSSLICFVQIENVFDSKFIQIDSSDKVVILF